MGSARLDQSRGVGVVIARFFLCSAAADFINGTTIEMDEGMLPGVLYESGIKRIAEMLAASGTGQDG